MISSMTAPQRRIVGSVLVLISAAILWWAPPTESLVGRVLIAGGWVVGGALLTNGLKTVADWMVAAALMIAFVFAVYR